MNLMYTILQWTPFPNRYMPISLWQLQDAEYHLKLNRKHYHEQAIIAGGLYWYHHEHAQSIMNYWQNKCPFAKFLLIGGMTAQHTAIRSN